MRLCYKLLVAVTLTALPHSALADNMCNHQSLATELQQIERNLAKPSVQKLIDKARDDYAADQDFDDINAALYLDAFALYLDIERNYKGGEVDAACSKYKEAHTMFDLLEAAE